MIDTRVAGDLHVELSQSAGIGVALIWIGHPPVPQHVVQHNHAATPDKPQRAFEIIVVAGLVGIDEGEVKAIYAFMFERLEYPAPARRVVRSFPTPQLFPNRDGRCQSIPC